MCDCVHWSLCCEERTSFLEWRSTLSLCSKRLHFRTHACWTFLRIYTWHRHRSPVIAVCIAAIARMLYHSHSQMAQMELKIPRNHDDNLLIASTCTTIAFVQNQDRVDERFFFGIFDA